MKGCTMTGNYAADDGGAVSNYEGSVNMKGCTMTGNSAAEQSGGAVYNYQGSVNMKGCTMNGNSAAYGGAVSIMLDQRLWTTAP